MKNKFDTNTLINDRPDIETQNKEREKERQRMKSIKYMLEGLQFWKRPEKATLYILTWMIAVFIIPAVAGVFVEKVVFPLIQPLANIIENHIYNATGNNAQLANGSYYVTVIIITAIFILFLPFVFRGAGKPRGAKKIDEKAANAHALYDGSRGWHTRPFVLSVRRAWWNDKNITNKHVIDYVFWSEWFDIEEWKDERFLNDFCHSMSLDRESVVVIRGGRKGKKITIRAILLDKVDNGGTTHDPLFKN